MDNIFEILIFAVIIYSFLSPLFKKKEQQKQTPQTHDNQYRTVDSVENSMAKKGMNVSEKNDNYDILHELEKMLNGNLQISEPKPPVQQTSNKVDPYDMYEPNKIKDTDLSLRVDKRLQQDVMDHNPIGYREVYDKSKNIRKTSTLRDNTANNTETETSTSTFERVLAGPRKQRAAIADFNRKLKNPASIKEYILFSEILGKPKALRR